MKRSSIKFLIIYPNFPTSRIINQEYSDPLGPLHLCTYLKSKGVNCGFLNCVVEKDWERSLKKGLKNVKLVGISAMTDQLPSTLKICQSIKNINPKIPIVMGQIHATLFPEQCVKNKYIDYALVGFRGELDLEQLINFIFFKKGSLNDIPGLVYKNKDGKIIISPAKRQIFDFEKLPLIDYSLLGRKIYKNLKKYAVGVLTSRGCPYGCAFCINSVIPENRQWQSWSPERTIKEIKNLRKLGVNKITFWDDCFFTQKERVLKILDLLEKEKIKIRWFANLRADHFNQNFVNEKFLKRLQNNGLTWISIGAESGSQRMLDLMNKGIKVKNLINAAEMIGKTKIIPNFSFMIGLPGETKEDILQTLNLMKTVQKLCPQVKFAGPQLYRPYPGSKFYDECLNSGWKPPQTLEEWGKAIEKESMETNPFNLPWIKNKKFTRTAWFYSVFLVLPIGDLINYFLNYCRGSNRSYLVKIIGSVGVILISFIGKLRMKLNFHEFQYEIKLLQKYRSALSS